MAGITTNTTAFARCVVRCEAEKCPRLPGNPATKESHVRKGNPAVLSLRGSADNLCPPQQAEDLHAALKKAGVTEKLVVYEGEGHGLSGANGAKAIVEMLEFLNKNVR